MRGADSLLGNEGSRWPREVLLTAHKAKLSLAYVRNPAGFVNEGTKEGEATLGRMQKISGAAEAGIGQA
jgi:hypothetical protein